VNFSNFDIHLQLKNDMGIFKNIFDIQEPETTISKIDWKLLVNLIQLDEIVSSSYEKPVLIFKHSTRCGISRMALKQFENEFDLEDVITPYFLDLLNHRDVSNEIASRFSVAHQSPQILIIKEGNAVYNASQSDIEVQNLKMFI
jgi:bacillithiol system protein YtxJ